MRNQGFYSCKMTPFFLRHIINWAWIACLRLRISLVVVSLDAKSSKNPQEKCGDACFYNKRFERVSKPCLLIAGSQTLNGISRSYVIMFMLFQVRLCVVVRKACPAISHVISFSRNNVFPLRHVFSNSNVNPHSPWLFPIFAMLNKYHNSIITTASITIWSLLCVTSQVR